MSLSFKKSINFCLTGIIYLNLMRFIRVIKQGDYLVEVSAFTSTLS